MSDIPKKPRNPSLGYGKPPAEHQFAKGTSGNPRGRPAKRERSLLPRQLRQDILAFIETFVKIRTPEGERDIPPRDAIILSLFKRGMSGHYASAKLFLEISQTAVNEHYAAHPEFAMLDHIEKHVVLNKPMSASELRMINKYRKATRRT